MFGLTGETAMPILPHIPFGSPSLFDMFFHVFPSSVDFHK